MSIGWFDGEIRPEGWFHPIAAGGVFDETLIAGASLPAPVTRPKGGGIGHGRGKGKTVYVKRGEKILLFRDSDAADAWLANEKEAEKARKQGKPYRPRKPAPFNAAPWKALELPKLRQLGELYGERQRIASMLSKMDYAALIDIYDKLRRREEEEIVALLLAA